MSCYRNILVALDGSPDADAALRHAVTLARDQNARLTLLSVVPRSPVPTGAGVPPPPDLTEVHDELLREALEFVPADVGVTTKLEHGDPAAAILARVEEGPCDLVVMGSHGHSRVHRALVGSVSERVLKAATVPVLLMRAEHGATVQPWQESATAQSAQG
ncbi:MAG TPA: universal stress protein [Solirubrobacterales bacterium]|jgi:nucleotide-binding universal stress UspA family protein